MMNRRALPFLAILPLLVLGLPADAYIEALTSFKGVLQESDVIARGVIDAVSVEKKVLILKPTKNLKGKCGYEKIKIDMNPGEAWHPEAALRHATVGAPVTIFYHKADNSDKAAIALIYNNRFFMTVQGGDEFWRFQKIELAMNRVYHGTAEELNDQLVKMLSGRIKPPAANAQLRPYTKDLLNALPPPPKEGEKWPEFDTVKAFKLEKTFAPDPDGFLQYWLVAGPLAMDATVPKLEGLPKEGDKASGAQAWKAYQSPDYLVDLTALAAESGRDASKSQFAGVTYIFCDQETSGLQLATSCYEAGAWRLNGKELSEIGVAKDPVERPIVKDEVRQGGVTLTKGRNVLEVVTKNKANPAGFCARFLDKDGKPFRNFVNDSSPR